MRLLERESQRAALAEYAREAALGDGRLVLVAGEAGVGKSSLVDALHESAAADERWYWGACDGLFTPRPLGPLFDVAGQLGGELDRLTREGGSRDALFAALLDQLRSHAALAVLVVEDVHWADEATLDLLRFLGRRLRGTRTLVLVTYRDDGLAPDDPLRVALGALATGRATRRLNLPPLSPLAVEELVGGSGLEAGPVYELTGGNPFFLHEILQHGVGELPTSVRDAVLARVAGLGASARRLLDVAALIGARVETGLLGAVTPGGLAALDEVLTSSVLTVDGEQLRFRHELARLALEQEVGPHRRAPIHAAVLAALLASGCADDARLAYHAEGAADGAAVLTHAPRAAHRAAELAAHREAAVQYRRAVRFCDSADDRTAAELLDALAGEAAVLDRWQEANDACSAALLRWRGLGDRAGEGAALAMRSRTLWRIGRGAESRSAGQEAVAVLEQLGPSAELARAYVDLAGLELDKVPAETTLAVLERARALAEELDLPAVVSDALNTLGCFAADLGTDWEGPLTRALDVALTHGLHDKAGRSYLNLYTRLSRALRFAEAEAFYTDGAAYCDEHDITTYGRCLRGERGIQLDRLGRWEDATALCRQLLAQAGASTVNRMLPLITLGRLMARAGEPGGREYLDEAASAADGLDDAEWIALSLLAQAEARWLAGEGVAAVGFAQQAWQVAGALGAGVRSEALGWLHRLGTPLPVATDPTEPYASQLAGRCAEAAARWDAVGCPYEAALALAASTDEALLRDALARFEQLGARTAATAVRRSMRDLGIRSIPAGARASTRAHPAGLTGRQRDVLELLCEGRTNEEIAERLFISVKTVDHHVSAILGKLGVGSRRSAVTEAVRLGLVGATG